MIYFSLIIRPFFRSVKDPAKAKLVPLKLSLFGPFVRKLIVLPAVFTCPRHFEFEFPGIIDEKARSLFFRDNFWLAFKWLLLKQLVRKILLPHFVAIIELYIFEKGQHGLPKERNDNWKDGQASTTFFLSDILFHFPFFFVRMIFRKAFHRKREI